MNKYKDIFIGVGFVIALYCTAYFIIQATIGFNTPHYEPMLNEKILVQEFWTIPDGWWPATIIKIDDKGNFYWRDTVGQYGKNETWVPDDGTDDKIILN